MSYQEVIILTPWDSQGNQITDSNGICHTIRGCHGGGYQQGYILQRENELSESDRMPESYESLLHRKRASKPIDNESKSGSVELHG